MVATGPAISTPLASVEVAEQAPVASARLSAAQKRKLSHTYFDQAMAAIKGVQYNGTIREFKRRLASSRSANNYQALESMVREAHQLAATQPKRQE